MTARPSGAFCSPPSPAPSAMGIMPMIMARAVMQTGRKRVAPASTAASEGVAGDAARRSLAKETTRMELAVATPMHMMAPMSAGTESVVWVRKRKSTMPAMAAGKRGDDDEGVEPGLEVDHDEQVDEDDGEDEAEEQAGVGGLHGLDLAADANEVAAGERRAVAVDDALDLAGDGAEVAVLHVGVDVEGAADVVVADDGQLGGAGDGGDVGEDLRASWRWAEASGNVFEVLEGLDLVLRRLGDDVVDDAVLGVEEELRRELR